MTLDLLKRSETGGLPISIAAHDTNFTNIENEVNSKAPLASPALTGTPTAPTASGGTNTTQIATTAFVTTAVSGVGSQYYKDSCRVATTDYVTLSGGAPNTLDNISLSANDRVLVKNQLTPSENGIYTITTLGSGSNGTWTRATDANTTGEILPGMQVSVNQGQANGGGIFKVYNTTTPTIGSTSITIDRIGSTGSIFGTDFANVALGTLSLRDLTSGSGNTAIGHQAGKKISSGGYNTAVGQQALAGTDGSTENTAIGYSSLLGIGIISPGIKNTAVGSSSGSSVSTGSNNTFLGWSTGVDNGGATNRTVIGSGATGTADNTVMLGSSSVTSVKWAGKTTGLEVKPLIVAASDETTALTAGTAKVTFRMPYAFTVTGVRASLTTAQTSGSIFTVDINEGGTTILSTKLTIDNTEKTSTTAATAAVISDTTLADDPEITVNIDQIGDGTAKGLKICLLGYPT